jgi:hypothetical protein
MYLPTGSVRCLSKAFLSILCCYHTCYAHIKCAYLRRAYEISNSSLVDSTLIKHQHQDLSAESTMCLRNLATSRCSPARVHHQSPWCQIEDAPLHTGPARTRARGESTSQASYTHVGSACPLRALLTGLYMHFPLLLP